MSWHVLAATLAACLVSMALTRLSITLSHRLRLLDTPDPRKVHKQPTPRLGGVGVVLSALLVGAPTFFLLCDTSTPEGWVQARHYLAMAVGAVFVFGMGVADDLWGVSSKLKLLTLLAASFVFSASGAGLNELVYDFEAFIRFPWLSWILTAAWITGMAVAFNFIDGLDGLAGGIALLAFAVMAYFQIGTGHAATAVPPAVVAGAILGFLRYNRRPALTFLGDGGSLTLGYLLGAMTLAANSDPKLGSMRAIIVPTLAMSVAIVDAGLTMFRRRYEQRRSMFNAERGHIHHRLMDRGLSHGQTVLLIHAISAACVTIGCLSLEFDGWKTLGGLALVVPLLWALFHAAGSVRTGEMVSAIRRKREIDRTSRRYRTAFEGLQLAFDEAHSFSHWWQTVCAAAEQLHFARVELPIEVTRGEPRTFRWVNSTDDFADDCQRIDAKIPIPLFGAVNETSSAEVHVPIVATLESAGERLALFSRLMAENGYQALRRINQKQIEAEQASPDVDPGEFRHLRVAVVHESFREYGGAERVVEQLIRIFPHCDLFSLIDFLPDAQRGFLQGKQVRTTFLQRLPFSRRWRRAYLPLEPLAIEQLDLSAYDLVVSSSALAAKGAITGPDQLHLCYCHGTAPEVWDHQHQRLRDDRLGYGPTGIVARAVLHYMRSWDARSSLGVDHFVARSKHVARRIAKAYRRKADIVFPPVDTDTFVPVGDDLREDYYIAVSRLLRPKRVDLLVEAFTQTPERRLLVIGDGPDQDRLRRIAGPNVEFLGRLGAPSLVRRLQRARALVTAAEDDFSLAAIEAMACSTPVIAYRSGRSTETTPECRGAVFYARQSVASLRDALERFESNGPLDEIDRKWVRQLAERRSTEQFVERMTDIVRRECRARWSESALSSQGEAGASDRGGPAHPAQPDSALSGSGPSHPAEAP